MNERLKHAGKEADFQPLPELETVIG